jgi:hypothetical protein
MSAPSWMNVYGRPVSRRTNDAIVGATVKAAIIAPTWTARCLAVKRFPER